LKLFLKILIFGSSVNSCHQSLLLYKNFKRINLTFDDNVNNKYSCDYNDYTISSLFSAAKQPTNNKNNEIPEVELKFARLVQKVMIPNLIILLTTLLIYLVIGLTSAFEAISVYCLFICKKCFISFMFKILCSVYLNFLYYFA